MSVVDEIEKNSRRLGEIFAQLKSAAEDIDKERLDALEELSRVAHTINATPSLHENIDGCWLRVQILTYLVSKDEKYANDLASAKTALSAQAAYDALKASPHTHD